MKRKILNLLMGILITISSFSQNTYPKKILWENDTVVAISEKQLVQINRDLNDYVSTKLINNSLRKEVLLSDSIAGYWKSICERQDSIISTENKKFSEMEGIVESLDKSLNKEKKKNDRILIGSGIGGTILGVLIGVLFIK